MQHNVNRGLATTPASTEIRLAFINDITVSHPVRTHPLQLVLADVLDTYSQSSTLAGIFSQWGVTAGHNTYNTYRMTMVNIAKGKGIQDLQLHVYMPSVSVVSVDKIDKEVPWQQNVVPGCQQKATWHTSPTCKSTTIQLSH